MSIREDAFNSWPDLPELLAKDFAKVSFHKTSEAETPPVCICGYEIKDPIYVMKEGRAYHAVVCKESFDARQAKRNAQ